LPACRSRADGIVLNDRGITSRFPRDFLVPPGGSSWLPGLAQDPPTGTRWIAVALCISVARAERAVPSHLGPGVTRAVFASLSDCAQFRVGATSPRGYPSRHFASGRPSHLTVRAGGPCAANAAVTDAPSQGWLTTIRRRELHARAMSCHRAQVRPFAPIRRAGGARIATASTTGGHTPLPWPPWATRNRGEH